MGSQWTHDGQKKTKCLSFRLHREKNVKVAENIQTGWDIETYASKINVVCQSVKEGTAGTEDTREYEEVHRQAVRSGNAVE